MHSLLSASLLLLAAASTPLQAAEAQQTVSRHGSFQYVVTRDEMTDDATHSAVSTSTRGGALFGFGCNSNNELSVVFLFDKYLAGDRDNEVVVQLRYDDTPAGGGSYCHLRGAPRRRRRRRGLSRRWWRRRCVPGG